MEKLLLLLVTLLSLSSCTNNLSSSNSSLNGKWNFVEIICYCEPLNRKPIGEITWTFDSKNKTISVVNNNTNQTLSSTLKTGVYSYSLRVESESGDNQININNGGFIYYKITDGVLAIGDSSFDEPSTVFKR